MTKEEQEYTEDDSARKTIESTVRRTRKGAKDVEYEIGWKDDKDKEGVHERRRC